ncbi:MAG: hypothetical protein QNJ37_12095 [Crocosphaera sp.]|nr:hypothetical protein [Crocosphaera sp.]
MIAEIWEMWTLRRFNLLLEIHEMSVVARQIIKNLGLKPRRSTTALLRRLYMVG